jgi:hypothetical protein
MVQTHSVVNRQLFKVPVDVCARACVIIEDEEYLGRCEDGEVIPSISAITVAVVTTAKRHGSRFLFKQPKVQSDDVILFLDRAVVVLIR